MLVGKTNTCKKKKMTILLRVKVTPPFIQGCHLISQLSRRKKKNNNRIRKKLFGSPLRDERIPIW